MCSVVSVLLSYWRIWPRRDSVGSLSFHYVTYVRQQCWPLSNWAHNEDLWKILVSFLSNGQQYLKTLDWVGVPAAWTLMEHQFLRFLSSSASEVDEHLILNTTSIHAVNHFWKLPIFIELHFTVCLVVVFVNLMSKFFSSQTALQTLWTILPTVVSLTPHRWPAWFLQAPGSPTEEHTSRPHVCSKSTSHWTLSENKILFSIAENIENELIWLVSLHQSVIFQ